MASDYRSFLPSRYRSDDVARRLSAPRSRRQVLRLLAGAAAGGLLARRGPDIARAEYRGNTETTVARATSNGQPGVARTAPRRSYQRHVSAHLV